MVWYSQGRQGYDEISRTQSLLRTVDQHKSLDGDWRALRGPVLVVQVVEAAAQALIEDVGTTKGKGAVRADCPTGSVNGTGLRWLVKLELVVGSNVACPADGVGQDTVCQSHL